jgi:transcriptional regulator GlxA family with amidase domain
MKTIFLILIPLCIFSCKNQEPKLSPSKQALDSNNYNVAFLIIDGVFNTELTAPYDIFHHTIFRDSIKAMNVFTVSNQSDAVTTFEGLKILPDYNFLIDSLPNIDILVVPSAEHNLDTDLENVALLDFVRQTSKKSLYVTSHCDGAFVLAKSGALEGIESTTFPGDVNAYKEMFPELVIHDSILFVHDGKFITSAGGAKSFEAALYLCEVLYGKKIASKLAQGLVIDWDLEKVPHLVVNKK